MSKKATSRNKRAISLAAVSQLKGDTDAALKQFARTRQLYGDIVRRPGRRAGRSRLAAAKRRHRSRAARLSPRARSRSPHIPVYRSHVLPVERIRERMMAAFQRLRRPPALRRSARAARAISAAVLARRATRAARRHARAMGQLARRAKRPTTTRPPNADRDAGLGTLARGRRRLRATGRAAVRDEVLHGRSVAQRGGLLPRPQLLAHDRDC